MPVVRRHEPRPVAARINGRLCTSEALEARQLLAVTPVALAVDARFGTQVGRAFTGTEGIGPSTAETYDLAVLPSGKTLIVGGNYLGRLGTDGIHDVAFGNSGSVRPPDQGGGRWAWWSALLPADDRIVVGGAVLDPAAPSWRAPLVARYTADGAPDGTFGPGTGPQTGFLSLPFTTATSPNADGGSVLDLAPLPNGSYLAAGFVRYDDQPADPQDLALWKIRADGTLDASFGDGGLRVYDRADGSEAVSSLVVRDDGGFFAATTGGVLSFDAAGSVAGTVGEAGPAVIAPGPGGTLVAARATGAGDVRVQRFLADGTADPAFGGLAGALIDFGGHAGTPTSVVVQPNGRTLVAAPNHGAKYPAFDVVALGPQGDPDAAFGTNGRVTELGSFETPARLAAGPGGRVVVGAGDTVVGLFARNFVLDPGITLDVGGPLPAADEGSVLPLSAAATYAGGTIQKYEWDAGSVSFNGVLFQPDAQGAATTLIVPDDAQPHNVTLKVTTSDGLTVFRELPLEIRNAPPTLAAIGVPSAAPLAVPVAVTGVAADPGGDPFGVTVDFGDGTAPAAPTVDAGGTFAANHAYAARGTFRVTITATDDDGARTTVQRDVLVADVVGSVFREADDDGRRTTGDQPVPGATVYVDSDGNGSLDEGEPRTLTDAAGEYYFTALGTGTFFVRLNPPPGLRATIPPGQAGPVVIDDDGPGARRDFGLTDRARISGIVFDDANASGVRDGSEAVLTGAFPSVYLDLNNNGWPDAGEPVAPLSSSEYVFANLDPGTYVVRYSPPLGAGGAILKERAQTFPSDRGDQTGHVVTLGRGGASSGNNFGSFFGNTPVTGAVYDDRNGNGNRESSPAEPLLDRVVYLDFDNDGTLDPDESRVRSNNSQAQPSLYLLPVVRGRTYTVRTMVPAAWAQTEPAGGAPYVVTVDPQNTGALQGLDFGTRRIAPAAVVGRHLVYFRSAFGGTRAFDPRNDAAVAPDKQALRPGERGTFANVSSYSRGINGLMIDLNDLKQMHYSEQLFRFDVKDDRSNVWTPVSSVTTIEIRRGAGINGSDRAVVAFGDRAVWNQWLRVTVLAGTSAGLAAPDVFYFGHLAGDAGGAASPPRVDALDLAAVRRAMGRPAPITQPADFNRDGRVDALDLVATRQNAGRTLTAFAAPAQPAAALRPAEPADTYRQAAKRRSVWEAFA